jgi:hypothetical protein
MAPIAFLPPIFYGAACLYFSVSVVVPPPLGSHEGVIYIIDFRKIPRCRRKNECKQIVEVAR